MLFNSLEMRSHPGPRLRRGSGAGARSVTLGHFVCDLHACMTCKPDVFFTCLTVFAPSYLVFLLLIFIIGQLFLILARSRVECDFHLKTERFYVELASTWNGLGPMVLFFQSPAGLDCLKEMHQPQKWADSTKNWDWPTCQGVRCGVILFWQLALVWGGEKGSYKCQMWMTVGFQQAWQLACIELMRPVGRTINQHDIGHVSSLFSPHNVSRPVPAGRGGRHLSATVCPHFEMWISGKQPCNVTAAKANKCLPYHMSRMRASKNHTL